MDKRVTFAIILSLLLLNGRPCYAPTDWVVNVLDMANGYVKEAGSVQEEYSGYANNYISGKVGELGDMQSLQKKTEKAQKLKDRADKYQKKAKKLKATADKVKEKKEALKAEAKKIQDKADQVKDKYKKAKEEIEEAKKKIDSAKEKIDEAKETVDAAKSMIDEAKETVDAAKSKIDEAKEMASGTIDAAKTKAGLENKDAAEPQQVEAEVDETELIDVTTDEEMLLKDAPAQFTPVPAISNVDALQSLIAAQEAVTMDVALPESNVLPQLDAELSAAEVLQQAESITPEAAVEAEQSSDFNLEEQLLQSDMQKAEARARARKPLLSNETLQKQLQEADEMKLKALRQSRRSTRKSFGTLPALSKEAADE